MPELLDTPPRPRDDRPAARGEHGRIDPGTLRRFLDPASVAVVGASESSPRHAVRALLASGLEVHLVNPRRNEVFGRPAHPDLRSLDRPVDAVLTLVNAEAAIEAVRAAREIGAGGVVVNAAGFAEVGPEGALLQDRLAAAADGMPVLGPNGNGFITVRSGAFLSGAPELPLRAGGIGLITHSGAFITDIAVAAVDRRVGFSSLISTGNEAVTDMADHLAHLVDDPATRAIGLVVEGIRRPEAFFAAVAAAHAAGKPVVALKLGRSRRGRQVAASHTGAVVGEGWVYEAVFRQLGVVTARDLGDLLDRLTVFDQLPPGRWSGARGVAVVTLSGGGASAASDVCEEEGLELPALEELRGPIAAANPHATGANPNDLTGFARGHPEYTRDVLAAYVDAPDVDTVVGLWTLGLESAGFVDWFLTPFVEAAGAAAETGTTLVLSATADGRIGDWAGAYPAAGVAVGHGLRGTVRALTALRDHAAGATRPGPAPAVAPVARPSHSASVDTPDGRMVRFGPAMELLAAAGVPVAPWAVVGEHDPAGPTVGDIPGPYVVKLADCPHRTELGAVALGVTTDGLADQVDRLRELARHHGLPLDVAVQSQLPAVAELFVGADPRGSLGPFLVCGTGGIHVEALGAVSGRLAPLTRPDALSLIAEIDRVGLFTGVRGREPLDRDAFAAVLEALGALTAGARGWLRSMDVNPVLAGDEGFVAVDVLMFVDDPRP